MYQRVIFACTNFIRYIKDTRLYVGMCYLKSGNMTSTCVSYFILCESLCTNFMIMYS